jgi:hypothetical protein
MFPTLLPLMGVNGPYINSGRNLLRPAPVAPAEDALDGPRAVFFTGEARNAHGIWQLGREATFVCTPVPADNAPHGACAFNALEDQQERARYGLLDWNVRVSLKK